MQSTQTVLHNEAELRTYLETAITHLAERAGHPRTDGTVKILTDTPPAAKPLQPTENNGSLIIPAPDSIETGRFIQTSSLPASPGSQPSPDRLFTLVEANSLPILHAHSVTIPAIGSREALIVTTDDFVTVPLVVDVWVTRCAPNVQLYRYTQPRHFASGLIVWSVLHHYFPRDTQLSAFHEPQTRLEYAEVWSQVDLILQKHSLTRIPVDVIAAVMAHRQVGQAILLMMLYEDLTNLKLPNPIPVLRNSCRGSKCSKWHFLQETTSNMARRPASFEQLLRRMFTTNQEMTFCRAHRRLQPPRINRHFESRVDFGSGLDVELTKLQLLMRQPQGDRCHLYHDDRTLLIKKHQEREKSSASATPRLVLLQLPFFTTDAFTKRPRARVG